MSLAPAERCVTTLRTLAIDTVEHAKSGHPGAPMGLAPVAWSLFAGPLRHAPQRPDWPNRDRFVLSAGHASALLYGLLHLTGYDLGIDDLKAFRQLHSRTPGHPERGLTPGVEVATGPLGQGIANAVGLALAERMTAERFNRPDLELIDHRTWFICSDGDLMEGISHEAGSLAGFLGLGKLIGIYDDNRISLDGPTSLSFAEDVPARFASYGWRVLRIGDGNDLGEIATALEEAQNGDGRPTLISCRTHIGFGSPNKHDSAHAHGSPLGAEEVVLTKRAYGWPEDAQFLVPDDVAAWRDALRRRGQADAEAWDELRRRYAERHPDDAAELARRLAGDLPAGWDTGLADVAATAGAVATRVSSRAALNAVAAAVPELVGGAADLASSTNTVVEGSPDIARGEYAGRNIRFGVREHAMGAIANGVAAYGGWRIFVSTFLTFSDYMRSPIRMAALMELPVVVVFTHDSVALGEDGPTHQPIEHLAALRAIPGIAVIRPADAAEAAAAWRVAMERRHAPTVIVASRQALEPLGGAADVALGAYVVDDGGDCVLIASGSEVGVARDARALLAAEGISARVVSMPSMELFAAQSADYRAGVLPPSIAARVCVEAGSGFGWHRWAGDGGEVVAIDRFGVSAPGAEALAALGITAEAVAAAARRTLGAS